jgi:hypothetical protein
MCRGRTAACVIFVAMSAEVHDRRELVRSYEEIRAQAIALAGGPGDLPQRVAECIRYHGILPERFCSASIAYADGLRAVV